MPAKVSYANLQSWSFSVYTQYIKCPFSVCLDKIIRVRMKEEENPHFVKGNAAHDLTAEHVSGKGKPPLIKIIQAATKHQPEIKIDLTPLKPKLLALRKLKAVTEQEWAFDRNWLPVDWRDWARAWLRIKTDVCADTLKPPTVNIVDWKTGRVHDEHKQQRSIYALGGLQLVQLGKLAGGSKDVKLTAEHTYIDTGQSATEVYGMNMLAPLKREWLARIKQMMNDTIYPTKPGNHCRYCKFRKSAGGPCPEKQ